MELCAVLPKDLVYMIVSFDASHREKFAETLEKIPVKGILRRMSYIESSHMRRVCSEMGFSTRDEVWNDCIEDPEYFAKVLSKCDCCTRHQIDRPTSLYEWNGPPTGSIMSCYNTKECLCTCSCRHINRWLIRIFKPDVEEIEL